MSGKAYIRKYNTPEGFDDLWMRGEDDTLTGLWFDGSRDAAPQGAERCDTPVFRDTARWLDGYFSGCPPSSTPSYRIDGLTAFRKDVIDELLRTATSPGRFPESTAAGRCPRARSAARWGGIPSPSSSPATA